MPDAPPSLSRRGSLAVSRSHRRTAGQDDAGGFCSSVCGEGGGVNWLPSHRKLMPLRIRLQRGQNRTDRQLPMAKHTQSTSMDEAEFSVEQLGQGGSSFCGALSRSSIEALKSLIMMSRSAFTRILGGSSNLSRSASVAGRGSHGSLLLLSTVLRSTVLRSATISEADLLSQRSRAVGLGAVNIDPRPNTRSIRSRNAVLLSWLHLAKRFRERLASALSRNETDFLSVMQQVYSN